MTLGVIFLSLFVFFNVAISLRIKATEMAIFRAMGSGVKELWGVFTLQLFTVVLGSAIASLMLVYISYGWIKEMFYQYVICSVWENIEERLAALRLLNESGVSKMESIWQSAYPILTASIVMVVLVSSFLIVISYFLFVKNSCNDLLKQR